MSNQETEENTSNVEKKSTGDATREQAQESTSHEALNTFAAGQGKADAEQREKHSRNEVDKGVLPALDLIDGQKSAAHDHTKTPTVEHSKTETAAKPELTEHSKSETAVKAESADAVKSEKSNPAETAEYGKKEGSERVDHQHENEGDRSDKKEGDGQKHEPAGDHGHPHGERETIDHNASEEFKKEVEKTAQQVLDQMPEHLRDLLKDIPVNGVKSITTNSGDIVNGTFFGPEGILLAEERDGDAPLETIAQHEYGHAFDETRDPPYSHDPEYRKMIDDAIENDPDLKEARDENPEEFYAEIFADLFASNLGARSEHLSAPNIDQQMAAAKEWIKQKMMAGAHKK